MLTSGIKLSGRKSPSGEFSLPALEHGWIIKVGFGQKTGAVPDILVSGTTANHEHFHGLSAHESPGIPTLVHRSTLVRVKRRSNLDLRP